jgi:hypothetical protein
LNALLKHIRAAGAALPFALLGLVSGCGGGGNQVLISAYSPLTGVFSDAPVTGLNYRTSSGAAGTTDELGYFNYAPGDVVTFSTGGVILGTVVPIVTPAGNATITPVDLAGGLTPSTNTLAQLTAQVLGTLNSIVVAKNIAASLPLASGMFTIDQNDATAIFQPMVPSYSPLIYLPPPYLTLYSFPLTGTNPPSIQSQLQAAATTASGVASYTSVADAISNMNQGVNAANVIGTVWKGAGTGALAGLTGTFYFQPDGNMTGYTSDGNILAGTWAGSTTAGAGVQFSLMSSPAGATYAGTIAGGASSATINDSGASPAFTITKATASILLTNNLYLGGWYGVYTPVPGSTEVYGAGTPVYLVLSPDGTFSGIMDGNQTNTGIIGGNWNPGNIYATPVSGIGTGAFAKDATATFSFNMSTRTGLYLRNGNVVGNISFSRTGVLAMNSSTFTSPAVPMATLPLTVNISWPASPLNFHSSFALAVSTNAGSYAIRSEANPLGNGPLGNSLSNYTMTDTISVPYYPTGASSYTLSVNPIISGSTNCSITSGASGGLPAASASVSINCI